MIKTVSKELRYQTSFTNEKETALADTTAANGGSGSGFRPHELLEAALATCMNMSLRMYADKHSIPLMESATTVTVDRSFPGEVFFDYSIDLTGPLSDDDRERLLNEVKSCSVRQTLSKKLSFRG